MGKKKVTKRAKKGQEEEQHDTEKVVEKEKQTSKKRKRKSGDDEVAEAGEGSSSHLLLAHSVSPTNPTHPKWRAPAKEPRKTFAEEEEEEENVPPPPEEGDRFALDDEDEEDETQASQASQGGTRRKRAEPVHLKEEDEAALVDWLKGSPMFWNKGLNAYKCEKQKKELWHKKAAEFKLTPTQLKRWYYTMRTAYGKLSKTQSGQEAKVLTEREQWIMTNFAFLKSHISRQASKQACSVSIIFLLLPVNYIFFEFQMTRMLTGIKIYFYFRQLKCLQQMDSFFSDEWNAESNFPDYSLVLVYGF